MQNNWLAIAFLSFMGGVVSNIIKPKRRGVAGFTGAACVGIFCGMVAAICSSEFGAPAWGQYLLCAVLAVFGDRILTALLCSDRIPSINANIQINKDGATGVQGEDNKINNRR